MFVIPVLAVNSPANRMIPLALPVGMRQQPLRTQHTQRHEHIDQPQLRHTPVSTPTEDNDYKHPHGKPGNTQCQEKQPKSATAAQVFAPFTFPGRRAHTEN
jgi:hypothetical protein